MPKFRTAVFGLSLAMAFAGPPAKAETSADKVSYVTFPTLHPTKPLTVAARFTKPAIQGKLPAVVVLHGSGGVSGREEAYQLALARAGIASIAIDEWSARGLGGDAGGRPATVLETLPDVYGARAWLAARSDIDAERIGVLGFSFGGVAAMLAATERIQGEYSPDGRGFAAAMPVYPVCWIYGQVEGYDFKDLTGVPVRIVTGAADEYDDNGDACPALARMLPEVERRTVSVMVIEGAHHGFDKPGEDRTVSDPFSHRGRGGAATLRYDADAMARSTAEAARFFGEALKAGGRP